MTCNVIIPCPRAQLTTREAMSALMRAPQFPPVIGDDDKPRGMSARQWQDVKKRRQLKLNADWEKPLEQHWMIACAEVEFPACACGHAADFLCDYPIGKGKTCDLALCGCCRESIGEERDLCRIHAAQFRGAERVVPQFSKPVLVRK